MVDTVAAGDTRQGATPDSATHNGEAGTRVVRELVTRLKPYVPGKPIEEVKRELGLPDDLEILKLASNENVLGPSPLAVEAMRQAAETTGLYPDDTCFELKNALADFWQMTPEHLIIGNGSDEIIHFLALALLEPEDEVIFAHPSFVQYRSAAMLAGCRYHEIPLTSDHRHDLPAMKAAVNARTKLIFIANPNNPTGSIVTREELRTLLDNLPPRVVVVLDQAYYEYVDDPRSPEGLDEVRAGRQVVVLQTFSKAYALAGLRCGYGLARPDLIGYLQQVRGPFNVNSLAQAAALASLRDPGQVARARALNASGREQLVNACGEMGLEFIPTQANFIMVHCGGAPSADVYGKLMQRGIIVRAGDNLGMPGWLRVTIGTSAMNGRFISSLRDILAAA